TRDPLKGKPDDGKTLVIITLVVLLGGVIVALIGEGQCCTAPSASGARGAAQTATLLMLVAAVAGTIFTFMVLSMTSGKSMPSPTLMKLFPLVMLTYLGAILGSFLVFQFFIVLSGASLRSRSLVSNTVGYATFFFLTPFIWWGLTYFNMMLMMGGPGPG